MYIPEWVLGSGLVIAFLGLLLVSDQLEWQKRKFQGRIRKLSAGLEEMEEVEQAHKRPAGLWIDPKQLPPEKGAATRTQNTTRLRAPSSRRRCRR